MPHPDLPLVSRPPRWRWPQLPGQCEVCRSWTTGALCPDCVTRFAAPRPRCGRCAIPLGALGGAHGNSLDHTPATCGDCLRDPPPYTHTVCVADYGFPWDRLIGAFKFNDRVELATALSALVAGAVRASGLPLPHCVLPLPLAPARLAARGYNQAWELARRVAASLQLPADATLLQRPVDTAPQAGLHRAERQRNLRSAFMVDPLRRADLQGRTVALVDDVMTTGATVRAAAEVLCHAGAAQVVVWVLARTPAP